MAFLVLIFGAFAGALAYRSRKGQTSEPTIAEKETQMQTVTGRVTGRNRLIIDGKNTEAVEIGPGKFEATFFKTFELRDLDAAENVGGGSAQPTPDPSVGSS